MLVLEVDINTNQEVSCGNVFARMPCSVRLPVDLTCVENTCIWDRMRESELCSFSSGKNKSEQVFWLCMNKHLRRRQKWGVLMFSASNGLHELGKIASQGQRVFCIID